MKVYPIILGCPKNFSDSEVLFSRLGYDVVDDPEDADTIFINTCTFIYPATKESINTILEVIEKYPKKKTIVAGCLVGRYGENLKNELKEVSNWIYPKDIDRISYYKPFGGRKLFLSKGSYAYVKISEGCNEGCTFCVIPKFKGGYKSRLIDEIVDEVKFLISSGKTEIYLVSQNTYYYGRDLGLDKGLLRLVEAISGLNGDFNIRILYGHPDLWNSDIKEAYKVDRVYPYFDIPFQHFDKGIISLMGRRRGEDELLDIVYDIRDSFTDSVIRTSFIVGFPNEGEKEFNRLLDYVERAQFDWMGAFEFYPEEGTKAYLYDGKVGLRLAKKRKKLLLSLQRDITEKRIKRFIGKRDFVYIDELYDAEEGVGHSWFAMPEIDGDIFVVSNGKKLEIGKKYLVEFSSFLDFNIFGDAV